ncbi:hypothetical protein FRC08_009788, partial [Ceratobasidium sp. 394]
MSTIDSGVYLLESDIDESLAERKHGRDKDHPPTLSRAMSHLITHSPQPQQHQLPSSSPGRIGGRLPLRTSHSAPPSLGILNIKELEKLDEHNAAKRSMESQPEDDEDDEDRIIAIQPTRLARASSVGNSYGVTGIGRGFDWTWDNESDNDDDNRSEQSDHYHRNGVQEIQDESEHPTPPAKELHNLPLPADGRTNLV